MSNERQFETKRIRDLWSEVSKGEPERGTEISMAREVHYYLKASLEMISLTLVNWRARMQTRALTLAEFESEWESMSNKVRLCGESADLLAKICEEE